MVYVVTGYNGILKASGPVGVSKTKEGAERIKAEAALDALAKADFFLACPGVGMPLCHNLIEAIAAGAIPILQYAAYLPQRRAMLQDWVDWLQQADPGSAQG